MSVIDYIIVVAYLIGLLGLGYFFKNQKDGESFFLGGKSFGWFPLTVSSAATQLSAISFISAPAFVGFKENGGMKWLTFELAVPLAMIFLMVFIVPPLYKANIVSIYSFLEKRFGKSTRTLISVVFQLSRAFATSVSIYTVALILNGVLGFSIYLTILVIGVVTLIYTYQGGMKAVVFGDVIQMIILVLGLLTCLYFALKLLGGWQEFVALLDRDRLTALDFNSLGFEKGDEFGFWPMLIGGFFLYSSYYGTDQSQVQRMLSAKDENTVKNILLSSGLIRFPITFLYCLMGLILGTLVLSDASFLAKIPVDKPDLMVPIFIRDYLPIGVTGLLIVAIFSAAMSSASSAINSISATTVEDIFKKGRQIEASKYVVLSRRVSLFWGVVCVGLAFFTGNIADTVIEAINKIGSVFYGPILATFSTAILVKFVNGKGANFGLLAGVTTNLILWLFFPNIFWFWWNIIGFVVTLLVSLLVSILTPDSQKITSFQPPRFYFNVQAVTILIGFFVAIVSFSYFLPRFF
ncbi:MAG: sodium:solute symporter family transporter [Luteibaculaceae bacterium]